MKQIYALLGGEPRKVVYIGCAVNAEKRRNSHWSQRNSVGRIPVKDWLCNLAEPPEFYVFENVEDDAAHAAEQYYTEIMRQINPDLLNVLDGQKKREFTRRKIGDAFRGKHLSESHKENIRKSRIGKHNSEEANRKLSETQRLLKDVAQYFCKKCGDGPFTHGQVQSHSRKTHPKNKKLVNFHSPLAQLADAPGC